MSITKVHGAFHNFHEDLWGIHLSFFLYAILQCLHTFCCRPACVPRKFSVSFFFLTKVKEALHINQTYYTLMRLQLGLSNINSTACICFPQSQHTNLKKDLHKLSSCPNRSSRDKGKKHPSFLLQIPLTLNNCAAQMHWNWVRAWLEKKKAV